MAYAEIDESLIPSPSPTGEGTKRINWINNDLTEQKSNSIDQT
jgi:hypothetical protein